VLTIDKRVKSAVDIESFDINGQATLDTELARTFLTVIAAGSFVGAADRLHVTQSTVSARIHALEEHLGCTLFVRNRGGTTLTAAGRQFEKHALTLVRTVERARHDVGVPRGFRDALTVGGRFGLWEDFLLHWLPLMRRAAPDVSLRAEIGFEADLRQGLVEGRLDLGVMYTPQSRPGLTVELLFEERLILVSSDPAGAPEPGPGYVYVDWGPEFYARHAASFPGFIGPGLTVNIGWLGQQQVLEHGGSGYFPLRLVRSHLENGRLFHVKDAPAFSLPAYAVYPADPQPAPLPAALAALRRLAAAGFTPTAP